jgi:hypothetical protein
MSDAMPTAMVEGADRSHCALDALFLRAEAAGGDRLQDKDFWLAVPEAEYRFIQLDAPSSEIETISGIAPAFLAAAKYGSRVLGQTTPAQAAPGKPGASCRSQAIATAVPRGQRIELKPIKP